MEETLLNQMWSLLVLLGIDLVFVAILLVIVALLASTQAGCLCCARSATFWVTLPTRPVMYFCACSSC